MCIRFSFVSIPFREDLHSDKVFVSRDVLRYMDVSIPFREDLHSDTKTQNSHSET